jgi:hypothetical protein
MVLALRWINYLPVNRRHNRISGRVGLPSRGLQQLRKTDNLRGFFGNKNESQRKQLVEKQRYQIK